MEKKTTDRKTGKILLIYFGGTIGQQMVNGVLKAPENDEAFREAINPLTTDFCEQTGHTVDYVFMTAKDSSNMSPADWTKLCNRLKKAQDTEKYDGVVVAHGTDTMAYSANAAAFALHGTDPTKTGLKIPVIITGSQKPIFVNWGDGATNLQRSLITVDECIQLGVADVLAVFAHRVMRGCRVLKMDDRDFDAFDEPAMESNVGKVDVDGVHIDIDNVRMAADAVDGGIKLASKFGRGMISLELAPGLEPNVILTLAEGGVQAMVWKSLGEACVCSEGEFSLIPALKQCSHELQIPVMITTKFAAGSKKTEAAYEVSELPIKNGGIPCWDMTDVCVDVKTRWILGNAIAAEPDAFLRAMATNYCDEVTQPDAEVIDRIVELRNSAD